MADLPQTMRSLAARKHCAPAEWEVAVFPLPTISDPTDMIVRVHAGAVMKGDCQRIGGSNLVSIPGKTGPDIRHLRRFPLKVGSEGAGIVVAIGSEVKRFKVGDAVYGLNIARPIFSGPDPGFCSEYAIVQERMMLPKPAQMSFEEAASLAGYTVTAYQCIKQGLALAGEESLEGKTVYIPGALSGGGSSTIQVAKNVFGAAKIISTVSTPKLGLVEQYLPGLVDQLVDYTTTEIGDVVPKGSVDFMVNTQMSTLSSGIPLLRPQTGVVVSIASIPPSSVFKEMVGPGVVPFWLCWLLDLTQLWYKWKLRGTNIQHQFVSGDSEKREDNEKAGEFIATGKVKGVFRVTNLSDIEAVREECGKVNTGKGGLGRCVVRIKE
ncbi:putative Alcohol dehydrogenase [Colletotrichum higginsianum IMI 349063]|uniref:Putative Alcohol dehydrogenase n=1 Tax=Colletotrichum higginsianum (strain IMI 349063) TaxID=759273 RepID=A0A1B7YE13_COLHI|nr:putative Alcohol dehydrogenase [Colletotrichum higginsianum IMI 349063]OBR10391.1 putative Alcohol dehydrogenase [Colletotrichum higginsianum IMI 349063]